MIGKSDSKLLALVTASILGQAPRSLSEDIPFGHTLFNDSARHETSADKQLPHCCHILTLIGRFPSLVKPETFDLMTLCSTEERLPKQIIV